MPRTRIRETNIEDISFLSETELNEFFDKVVVTGTDTSTTVQETFADYFPGQGLIQGAGSVTVITGSNLVTVSGSAGGTSGETLDKAFTANGSVAEFDYVYLTEVDDQVSPAKADSVSTIEVLGMATETVTSGTSVAVRLKGIVENAGAGLTTGSPLFLDASTAGDFTETPPSVVGTFILHVGHAVNTTDVYVNVNPATASENLGGTGFDLQSAYANSASGEIQTDVGKPVIISGTEADGQVDFKVIGSGIFTEALQVGENSTFIDGQGVTSASGIFQNLTVAGVPVNTAGGTPKNAIINGNFDIWQRGTSFSAVGNDVYSVDRMTTKVTGAGTFDMAQSTTVPAGDSAFSLKLTVNTGDASLAASDIYAIRYRIEGFDAQRFALGTSDAKQMTLSFWVRSSVTGTYVASFRNGAQNRVYPAEYVIDSADTWEKKEITIQADTTGTWLQTTGIGLTVAFSFASGTDNHGTEGVWQATSDFSTSNQVNWMASGGSTFYLSQLQLEVGTEATEFERRIFSTELDSCYRYFWRLASGDALHVGDGEVSVNDRVQIGVTYPREMRSTPSLAFSANTHFTVIGNGVAAATDENPILINAGTQGTAIRFATAGTGFLVGGCSRVRTNNVSTTLDLDAEL